MPTWHASPRRAVGGIVHRAVDDVAAGRGALHAMREFDAVFHEAAWVRQIAQPEGVEVLADGGDDLVVGQPDDVGAALERCACGLKSQGGDAVEFGECVRVVEQQVLPGIAKVADGSGGIDGDGVAGCDAVVIDDFVGVTIAGGIEQEQADAGHAFEAIHAVAVEGDVEGVRISLHAGGLAPREDFRFFRRPFSD